MRSYRKLVASLVGSLAVACLTVGEPSGVLKSSSSVLWAAPPARAGVAAVAVSADGESLAVARGRELLLLDAATGGVRAALPAGTHRWNAVACLADGRVVAAGGTPGQGGEWLVWNPSQPGEPRRFSGHADTIHALDVHRREPWLLTASYDRELRLWNLETGAGVAVLKHHTGPVQAARFGPAEGLVVSGAADQTVKLWQVPAGERLATLSEATRGVQAVACHPASPLFAAAGADRSLRIYRWDGQQAVLVRSSLAHDSSVLALAFSPDGQTLFSAAEDQVIKAWQVEPLRERHVYPAQPDWPLALAVAPSGEWLACGLANGSLRLFDTAAPRQRAEWLQVAQGPPQATRPATEPATVAALAAKPAVAAESQPAAGEGQAEGEPAAAPPPAPAPRLDGVSPRTVIRGQTVTLTLSGANLDRLEAVDCASAGLVPRLLDPQAPDKAASQRQVSLDIPADWNPGAVQLRVRGPGGSSAGRLVFIGSLLEVAEKEPNNAPAQAQAVALPAQLHGTISARGDVDRFQVELAAGEPLVLLFANTGHGSALQPRLTVRDSQGRTVAQVVRRSHRGEVVVGFTATAAGQYEVEIADRDNTGGGNHVYWLQMGAFPVVTDWFPLGLRGLDRGDRLPGEPDRIALRGLLLEPELTQAPVASLGTQSSRPVTSRGPTVNAAQFESSPFAELVEQEPNAAPAQAAVLPLPGAISGRIESGAEGRPDEDLFGFDAVAGEPLWLEVLARRRGSPLDSLLEILDAEGRPLGRHTLRAVSATYTELRDHDSRVRGIRLHNWEDFLPGDLLLLGGELAKIQVLPLGPDEDLKFYERGGVRLGYLGTTPEAHALNRPVYKVELHPAGTTLPPNGLPQVALAWRNDDGGPELQADSALLFEPPATGRYFARVSDVRRAGGADFVYRLLVRRVEPDFRVRIDPEHPNVPQGGAIPATVTIDRLEGFNGPVDVELTGLPPGFSASTTRIGPDQLTGVLQVAAAADAQTPTAEALAGVRVVARGVVAGERRERVASPSFGGHHLAVTVPSEVGIRLEAESLRIAPGQQLRFTATIERRGGLQARIPVEALNLPFGLRVLDVGLNGVLINEGETSRNFEVVCDPWAEPGRWPFFAVARIESKNERSASNVIELEVVSGGAPTAPTPGAR